MNPFGFGFNDGFGMPGMGGMSGMGGMPGMGNYAPGIEDDDILFPKKRIIFITSQGLYVTMKYNPQTTIDQALKEYLQEIEKPELIGDTTEQIVFLYNARKMEFGDETTIETYFKNTGNPKVIVCDPHNLIGNFNLCNKLYKEIDKLRQQISNLKIINNSLHQQLFLTSRFNSNIPKNDINEEKYIKEINDLKSRLSRYENNIEVNLGDLVVINFESVDGQIRRGIQCMKNEIFVIAEEKLYKFYEAFRDTNNKFTINEIEIKRFKTIEENNIKDGDKVVLETI